MVSSTCRVDLHTFTNKGPTILAHHGQTMEKDVPGDWLNVHGQLQLGQLVDILVDGLAHLWHANQLTDLAVAEVVESLPWKILLLDPADDVLRQLLELSQWSHGLPPVGGNIFPLEKSTTIQCYLYTLHSV